VMDPFGHKWHIATRIEQVAPAEMQRRMDKMYE
jgi:PhnB protein